MMLFQKLSFIRLCQNDVILKWNCKNRMEITKKRTNFDNFHLVTRSRAVDYWHWVYNISKLLWCHPVNHVPWYTNFQCWTNFRWQVYYNIICEGYLEAPKCIPKKPKFIGNHGGANCRIQYMKKSYRWGQCHNRDGY